MRLRRYFFSYAFSLTLHVLVGVGISRSAATALQPPATTGQPGKALVVFAVPPAESRLPGLNPIDTTEDVSMIRGGRESSALSIPGFTFDSQKIADRATVLFPFLTPGLRLEDFALAPKREVTDDFRYLPPAREDQRVIASKPPLVLSAAALQTLIDQSWSRRDRWSVFRRIATLTEAYDPDAGSLFVVLRAYIDQNGLQPYVDGKSRDPRLWAELGLAADHVSFAGFVSRYAARHPSTKATTELLFLLDELTQASLDALVTLLQIDPEEDLQWTRDANRDAFDLIVQLRRYYSRQLERRGLASSAALRTYYDRVRLAILAGILQTTPQGYRAGDAHFLIGAIYWGEGDAREALRAWRKIRVDVTDRYATVSSAILEALRDGSETDTQIADVERVGPLASRQINRALDGEHGRWIIFSFERLRRFGYHFDTF